MKQEDRSFVAIQMKLTLLQDDALRTVIRGPDHRPIYRVETLTFSEEPVTTIVRVDEPVTRLVATIAWSDLGPTSTTLTFAGRDLPLEEFLKKSGRLSR